MLRPTLLLCMLGLLAAAEGGFEHRRLLPMDQLLQRLAADDREHVLMPLDEYRVLGERLAALDGAAQTAAPHGVWLESAEHRLILVDEQQALLRVALQVARGEGEAAVWLPVMPDMPAAELLAASIDGHAAGIERRAWGWSMLVPALAHAQAELLFRLPLQAASGRKQAVDDQARMVTLRAAPAALRRCSVHSRHGGALAGRGVVPAGDGRWQILPLEDEVHLVWRPGAVTGEGETVWGIEQKLTIDCRGGERRFRWQGEPHWAHGEPPALIDLGLPAGWTITAVEGLEAAGDLASAERFRLRDRQRWVIEGLLDELDRIDLPALPQAAWAGGRLELRSDPGQVVGIEHGPLWRPLIGADLDAWRIVRPGQPARVEIRPAIDRRRAAGTAYLLCGEQRWQLQQELRLVAGAHPLFATGIALPAGWRLADLQASHAIDAPLLREAQALEQALPGEALIHIPAGLRPGEELVLRLGFERQAPDGITGLLPARFLDARSERSWLAVTAAPWLQLRLDGGSGWYAAPSLDPWRDMHDQRGAVLAADEGAEALRIGVGPRAAHGSLESVAFVLPVEHAAHCRIELRGELRQGRLERLLLELPFDREHEVVLAGVAAEQTWLPDGRLELRFADPWEGALRCRLSGQLAEPQAVPRIAVGDGLVLRQQVAWQVAENGELRLLPGADAEPAEVDSLPGWAKPWPGPRLVAALRLLGPAVGSVEHSRHEVLPPPDGFVDDVDLRWRIGRDGQRMLLRARIAAPGSQSLPLQLPPGWRLQALRLDGRAVDPRLRDGAAVLPLSGRTLAAIELVLVGPPAGDRIDLTLPRLGALPLLSCRLLLGLEGGLSLKPAHEPGTLLLEPVQAAPRPRPPYALAGDQVATILPDDRAADDPRFRLALEGEGWRAEGSGNALRVMATIEDHRSVQQLQRLAWAAGILLALLGLLLSLPWRLALAGTAAAVLLVCWLGGQSFGPLQALAESFLPAVLLVPLLRMGRRQAPAAVLLLAALQPLSAAEVWMGYGGLDEHGRPVEVQVAVAREDLLAALSRLRGETGSAACDLALGSLRVTVTAIADDHVAVTVEQPVVVCAGGGRQLYWQPPPGQVAAVQLVAEDDRGAIAVPIADAGDWRALRLPATRAFSLRWQLQLPREEGVDLRCHLQLPRLQLGDGDERQALLPPAGAVTLAASGWEPAAPERGWAHERRWWMALTAPQRQGDEPLELRLRPERGEARIDTDLRLHQDLLLRSAGDHLAWRAALTVDSRAFGIPHLRLRLPAELRVVAVEGVQAWRQNDDELQLQFAASQREQRFAVEGVLPAAVSRSVPVRVGLPGVEREAGSLSLAHGDDWRLRLSEGSELRRGDLRAGADITYAWSQDDRVAVRQEAIAGELRGDLLVAVVHGRAGWRARVLLSFSGDGRVAALQLRLPPGWRLQELAGEDRVVVDDQDLRLHRRGGYDGEDRLHLSLAGDGPPRLDEHLLGAAGLQLASERWLLGHGAGHDLRCRAPGHDPLMPAEVLRRFEQPPSLLPDERWQLAFRRNPSLPLPDIELVPIEPRVVVDGMHYLVVDGGDLRWHLRLSYRPEAGRIERVAAAWPAGWRLVDWRCDRLGRGSIEDRELAVELGTAGSSTVHLDLVLSASLREERRLAPPRLDPALRWGRQQVALAYDPAEVLHLEPAGLRSLVGHERLIDREALPRDVEVGQLPQVYAAERPAWSLGLRRERLSERRGVDGVARLVDVELRLTDDGALRGRAAWVVLNRSRQRLALEMPEDCRLWECRVDQRLLRPQLGEDGRRWIPVTPMRIGDAATRISYTWQQAVDPARLTGAAFPVHIPRLADIDVQLTTWRVTGPAGLALQRVEGSLREEDAATVVDLQAQGVIEELRRLRGELEVDRELVDDRLELSIGVLESELADYLHEDLPATPQPRVQAAEKPYQQEFDKLNSSLQQGIGDNRLDRRKRRKSLQMANLDLQWEPAAKTQRGDVLQYGRPQRLPWRDRRRLQQEPLDSGSLPAGYADRHRAPVLGMELIGDPDGEVLVLKELGGSMRLVLEAEVSGDRPWPRWPWLLVCLLPLALPLLLRRRP